MIDWVGRTIGNYRVEALLGSGGMGQVFRGTHQTLNRAVAIKVLHDQYAGDASFRARFQQEAQAAAALEHPNIIQVFDFGEQDGRLYLVMELLADGSLRTLLQQQPSGQPLALPLGIALMRQAAEGLHYAHEHRMVHRDIKPDNLLLKRDASGYRVKITDFGLARLAEGGVHTAAGTTMGTPAYMSPEQCQGIELDGRSDIYSLGIVLFEVTTGLVPFDTRSLSDAVFKHIYTPPPSPRASRPDIPPALETMILRCLAKAPAERFATAGELAAGLATLAPVEAQPAPATLVPASGATQIGRAEGIRVLLDQERLAVVPGRPATMTMTLVNLGATPVHVRISVEGIPPNWVDMPPGEVEVPAGAQVSGPLRADVPRDGSARAAEYPVMIRAVVREDPSQTATATTRWFVQPFGSTRLGIEPATVQARGQGRYRVVVANDGNRAEELALNARDETGVLRFHFTPTKVTVEPGQSVTVPLAVRAPARRFKRSTTTHRFSVSATGGDGSGPPPVSAELVRQPSPPFWLLPLLLVVLLLGAGAAAAYTLLPAGDDDGEDEPGIVVAATDTAAPVARATTPVNRATEPPPARTSTVVVGVATAPPEETETEEPAATEVVVEETEEPPANADGRLIFSSGRGEGGPFGNLALFVMEDDGSGQEQVIDAPGDDWAPAWSNAGDMIAWASKRSGNDDIWVAEADGSNERQLTTDPGDDGFPAWSPDDSRIGFSRNGDLFVVDPETGGTTQLTSGGGFDGFLAWSPDGSRIAWTSAAGGSNDIWLMNADGSEPRQLTFEPANDYDPVWAPDGSVILFVSDRLGDHDLFTLDPDDGKLTQLTNDAADEYDPAWSPDGTWIAFLRRTGANGDLVLMRPDGSDQHALAADVLGDDSDINWSPDSTAIAFLRKTDEAYVDVWAIELDGTGERRLTDNPSFDGNVDW